MPKGEGRLSLREAADALGVSEVTARRWVKAGKLKAHQPGRKYLIPSSAVDDLLESDSGKARAPSPEPSRFYGLEEERRLLDYRKCRQALDRFCDYWEQALERDQLDRRACEDFNIGAELTSKLLLELWRAEKVELRIQRGEDPQTVDKSEPWPPGLMEKSELSPAIDRWMLIGRQMVKIAKERFGEEAATGTGVADLRDYARRKAG